MDSLATYTLLTAAAFFVVLAFGLLFRYRQVSQKLTASTDLGKDLWGALDLRLNKQDERILDMMGRVEVIQSRALQKPEAGVLSNSQGVGALLSDKVVAASDTTGQSRKSTSQDVTSHEPVNGEVSRLVEQRLTHQDTQINEMVRRLESIQSLLEVERREPQAPPVRTTPIPARPPSAPVGPTERLVVEMLAENPRTSVEIRQRFNISREHSARLLKALFDRGLVLRNDSSKPFVYEITDAGRRYLSAS